MTKLLVVGVDGAAWSVIKPNLDKLPYFAKLMREGKHKSLIVREQVLSPSLWATIFSGKTLEEHGHSNFVIDGKLQTRDDVNVRFAWDALDGKFDVKALQVPFIMPPYNFKCEYMPIGYGASKNLNELEQDTDAITEKALGILKENPDLFIVVYSALDKVQHFHWGEELVLGWYKKIDTALGMLMKYAEKIIVVSDHGFCARGEAKVQTLPEISADGEKLKGDHHEEAILITRNINYEIKEHKDVFNAIMNEMGAQ